AVEPHAGLEPLPVAIEQRDQRDRHFEQARRQRRDPVEGGLVRRIQDFVTLEREQPIGFVRGLGAAFMLLSLRPGRRLEIATGGYGGTRAHSSVNCVPW